MARAATGVPLVALGAALWGTDPIFRRGLALELPPATVVFYEHLILTVVLVPVLWRARGVVRSLSTPNWLSLVTIGVGASAAATVLFTWAFRLTDVSTPLLLQKLQPFVAVAGAHVVLHERLRPRFAWFAAPALVGAYLVSFADPTAVSLTAGLGAAAAVGAAALWGMGTVLGRSLGGVLDPWSLTALRFAIGLPASAVLAVAVEGTSGLVLSSAADLVPLCLLALVPGLAAIAIYYRGLRTTSASAATLAELAFPVSALLITYAVFDATLTWTQWLGVALVVTSVTLMGLRGRRGGAELGVLAPPLGWKRRGQWVPSG